MIEGFDQLLSDREIASIVSRLGIEISRDYPDGLLLVGVLKGCVFFFADLLRALSIDCEVDFLSLSVYRPGETGVRILKDLEADVGERSVLLVEDVVDTGFSASYVADLLSQRGAKDVAICALIDRPTRRILPVAPRYVGISVQEQFVVGYGLDYAERFRNLSGLYQADSARLEANLDRFVEGEAPYRKLGNEE